MITENKYTFIIIDDHPLIRDGVINFIKAQRKFECIGEFENTRAVINSNFSGKPDIIILDLNLGNIDGEKMFPFLKQKFPASKIIAYTQYEGREKELEKIGFDGYMVKSEKESLIDVMLTVLEGKKYFKSSNNSSIYHSEKFNEMDDFLKMKELTPRETEIAKYLMQGFSNREIAERIIISESTVETHRKHIKEKLGAKSRREFYDMLKKYLE